MTRTTLGLGLVLLGLAAIAGGCPADPQTVGPDSGSTDVSIGDAPPGLDVVTLLDVPPAPDLLDVDDDASDALPEADSGVLDANSDLQDIQSVDSIVGPGAEPRTCTHVFTYTPGAGDSPLAVYVPGTFNNWDETVLALSESAGTWTGELALASVPVGSHGYKFRVTYADGTVDWRLDPANIMRRFDEGIVNSKLLVPDCHVPKLVLLERTVDTGANSITVEVAVRSGVDGELAVGAQAPTATYNGTPVASAWDAAKGTLRVELTNLADGKHSLRFDATAVETGEGAAEPLVTSVWFSATDDEFEWRDAVLYFAFVDRFADADPTGQPSACPAADPLGNWLGGDWPGITQAIEDGYFDDLGVNALWLNAPMDNPDDCVSGIGGYTYTAYHGYFPQNLYAPEEHFGTLDDLRQLVATAHQHGIRVLIDLVANHMYETAPEWIDHEFDGWFNTPIYVCGWDQPETCWFQSYLPDFDFRNDEVVEHLTEAALWWARETDVDGFRVDAVKHVHPHLLNTLRAKLDKHIEAYQDLPFWTVGETFVGTWGGGSGEEQTIKQYIGDDQLYGQFDFPLYWATLSALGRRDSPLSALSDVLQGVNGYFAGDLMASFLGNHDVARYVSHANGDIADIWGNGATQQGWENPPAQPSGDEPYARLEMAFAFLNAAPWVPLIYYGDEIGLAGAGDPDNRRMMVWSGVTARQEQVRTRVGQLMAARRTNRALRRGDLSVPQADDNTLVIVRTDGASQAVSLFNVGPGPQAFSVGVSASSFVDAVTGETLTASGSLDVTVGPGSARVLTTVP